MIDLRILRPRAEKAPVRFGELLEVVVDLDLDAEPWFALPSFGRRVSSLDGEPEPAVAFDTGSPVAVKALVSGRAETRDTGHDDHSPPPMRAARAGRGCEVTVTSGGFELTYSHLKRGGAKVGRVRAGETIGMSGNTGRCVDGARRAFVKLAARRRGAHARVEEFTEPIVVESTLNGQRLARPLELPAGEVRFENLVLERVLVNPERGDIFRIGENELEVLVRRGAKSLARVRSVCRLESP